MRPWLLLLLSLLVSDLTPPGDGNWVMDYFSWTLCRKLILGGQMARKGLKILRSQTECTCFKRNYMYAVLLHKQRSYSFCWPFTVHSDHGHTLSFKDLRRIMQRDQIPVLVCLFYSVMLLKKRFPFYVLFFIRKTTPTIICICFYFIHVPSYAAP